MKHLFLFLALAPCVNPLFAQDYPASIQQQLTPIDRFLDKGGRLNTPPDFQGSLDPEGFRMTTDAKGAPRFLPLSPSSVPGDSSWEDRFGLGDLNDAVRSLAVNGSDVYAGGYFTTAGGMSANHIAKWNGSSWSALGSGMNDVVFAIVVSGNDVYAGGSFTMAGGVSANYIAKWNGSSWSTLGSGVNQPVNALASSGNSLYAGGSFTTAGGISANRIAKWNGSNWSSLGSGMNDYVNAIAVIGSNVYAGGWFTTAGGVSANFIAKWDGTSWSNLGSGLTDRVRSIASIGTDIYAGGSFGIVGGGTTSYNIAKWDGSTWSPLLLWIDGEVWALTSIGTNLYVGGDFIHAGVVTAPFIVRWNGSSWFALGSGMNNIVYALAVRGSDVYAGGSFTTAGGKASSRFARWIGPPPPPIPHITSFAPALGVPGSMVTITGTYFNATPVNDTVYFGGVKAAVTAASESSLTVTVPTGATYAPISVTVGGLTAYSSARFLPTFAGAGVVDGSSFAAKVDFPGGGSLFGVALGDIDGDGKLDVAMANNGGAKLSILRNTSTAGTITPSSFASVVDFTAGTGALDVAIGDLDGDGKLDVAVVNYNSGTVSVFRNTSTSGSIMFAPKVDFTTGAGPFSIAIGDLDGDGRPEIAVANNGSLSMSILRNTSTVGSISFASKVDFAAGDHPYSIAIGDVNGDGKPDLAVSNYVSNTVSVFRNMSSPGSISGSSFAAKVDFTTGTNPTGITLGDIDGDGKLDVAVANEVSATVSVFRNISTSGSIAFSSKVDFATGSTPELIALGDVDGDGKPDIAVANNGGASVSVLKNTSTSGSITSDSFAPKVNFTTGNGPFGVAIGDIDGDGKPELVAGNNSGFVSVLRNTVGLPTPHITSFAPASGTVGSSVSLTGANFDASAANNIVYFGGVKASIGSSSPTSMTVNVPVGASYSPISVTTRNLTAYSNDNFTPTFSGNHDITTNSFAAKRDFAVGSSPYRLAIGDLDGDVQPDLVVPNGTSQTISVLRNLSTTDSILFAAKVDFAVGAGSYYSILVDVDGDGKLDVVTANTDGGTFSVYRNTSSPGSISFASRVDVASGSTPFTLSSNDIDGDGKPEIVTVSYSTDTVSIFRNTSTLGSVSFATRQTFAAGSFPRCAVIRDLDGDGRADLVVANEFASSISVFRNTSSGGSISFASRQDFTTATGPFGIAVGDLDGDAKLDVAAYGTGNTCSLLRNTSTPGSIAFAPKQDIAWQYGHFIALADVDGDGKADLVTDQEFANTVSVHKNTSTPGAISFATGVSFATGNAPFGVAVNDLNGDGKPEIVVSNKNAGTVSVFRNTTSPPPTTISSVSPTSGLVGSSVTITGTSFSPTVSQNVVYFGGASAAVTAASATSLTVTVPTGATYAPISVTVGGLTAYSSARFLPTFAGAGTIVPTSFAAHLDFTSGTSPEFLAIGDFDGDGKLDLATAATGSNAVSVFRNTGSTGAVSFAARFDSTTGTTPTGIAIADIDGDGKLDLVNANYGSTNISVFRNTGTPGSIAFASRVNANVTSAPFGIAIGDLDGDGKPDVVAANEGGGNVSVLRNTSTVGSVSFAAKVDFTAGNGSVNVAIADLDGDGRLDLVVVNQTAGTISILRNTSTGGSISFATKVDFTVGSNPNGITICDLDGDGKLDIAVANRTSNSVSVFRNTSSSGSITLAARIDFTTGTDPRGIAIGDLDGDGEPDLAVVNYTSNTVSVLKNTSMSGSIILSEKVDFATGVNPKGFAIGDVDGDGKADLVAGNNTGNSVSVLRNTVGLVPFLTGIILRDNGGVEGTLYFGTVAGATDGLDPQWGERELPPLPPPGAFDVRWLISGVEGVLRDVRDTLGGARQQAIYIGKMQPGTGGYPFVLRWNHSELPTGTFTLRDHLTGTLFSVAMKQQDSLVVNSPFDQFEVVYNIASTSLFGVKTVGVGGDYLTLKQAFDAVNALSISDSLTLVLLDTVYNETDLQLTSLNTSASAPPLVVKPLNPVDTPAVHIHGGFTMSNFPNLTLRDMRFILDSSDIFISGISRRLTLLGMQIRSPWSFEIFADSTSLTFRRCKIEVSPIVYFAGMGLTIEDCAMDYFFGEGIEGGASTVTNSSFVKGVVLHGYGPSLIMENNILCGAQAGMVDVMFGQVVNTQPLFNAGDLRITERRRSLQDQIASRLDRIRRSPEHNLKSSRKNMDRHISQDNPQTSGAVSFRNNRMSGIIGICSLDLHSNVDDIRIEDNTLDSLDFLVNASGPSVSFSRNVLKHGNKQTLADLGFVFQDTLMVDSNTVSGCSYIELGTTANSPTGKAFIVHNTITGNEWGPVLYCQDSTFVLSNVIVGNDSVGLALNDFDNQKMTISQNTIAYNGTGIQIDLRTGHQWPRIESNKLHGNQVYAVQCLRGPSYPSHSADTIDMRSNWWGSATTAQMDAGPYPKNITSIFDRFDNDSLAFVNYSGWLHDSVGTNQTIVSTNILAGWNMISNPVTNPVPDDSAKHLFPTIASRVFEFSNGYHARDTMGNGKGYWGKFPVATTNAITGIARTRDSVSVVSGWNMVGSISNLVDTNTITSVPAGIRASNWFGFFGGYAPTTQIVPGKAYWVKASAAGKFVFASSSVNRPGQGQSSATAETDGLNSLTITDSKGGSQMLYFGADASQSIPVALYVMPPIPPAGAFDARFETTDGGSMVQTYVEGGAHEFSVSIQSEAYPLTVKWKMKDAEYELVAGGAVQSMRGEGTMKIASNDVQRLVLKLTNDAQLPKAYALSQNYPNPFNPSTTIKYDLPVDGQVSLKVFNVLGQEVATLVNEEQRAGYKSIEWNATNVASGVYFCQLQAGSFTSVKKMLFLK